MSIDRGNEILLNTVKNDNKKIIDDIAGKQSMKDFINLIQLYNSDLDFEMRQVD